MLTAPTPWTDLDLRAVLGHLQLDLQQVHNLPGHLIFDVHAVPGLSTGTVPGERKNNHLICLLCHLERLARVATLSARRPIGLLALTLRYPGLVLARWLIRRLSVPIELRPDRLKFGQYLGQLGFQTCAVGAGILADALLYPIRRVETRC